MTFLFCGKELTKHYTVKFSPTRKACCVAFLDVGETKKYCGAFGKAWCHIFSLKWTWKDQNTAFWFKWILFHEPLSCSTFIPKAGIQKIEIRKPGIWVLDIELRPFLLYPFPRCYFTTIQLFLSANFNIFILPRDWLGNHEKCMSCRGTASSKMPGFLWGCLGPSFLGRWVVKHSHNSLDPLNSHPSHVQQHQWQFLWLVLVLGLYVVNNVCVLGRGRRLFSWTRMKFTSTSAPHHTLQCSQKVQSSTLNKLLSTILPTTEI